MKIIRKIIIVVIVISIIFVGYFVIKGYNMYREAIETISLEDKIKQIRNVSNYTKLDEIPKIYLDAVISVEDHRFYEHNGIDIISIGRALYHDIKNKNFNEGGSTITQQLAKNIYFTQEKKLIRKIAEIFMAFKLESELEKDEILELYVNTSYFGNGYYCIKDASKGYFNKDPKEMNDYESTLLAGLPNAPSIYGNNNQLARERQQQILNLMIEYEYLTETDKEIILTLEE